MDTSRYSTWLEIDLGAIRSNIQRVRQITGAQVMAVVKANGYGHGSSAVACAAVSAGATWCGVSRIEEALALRQAGLACDILVMGYSSPACIPDAMAGDIALTVYDPDLAKAYCEQAHDQPARLRLHLKVETGMGRLGLDLAQVPDFIRWANAQPRLQVEAIFTHFGRADEPGVDATHRQIERFERLLEDLGRAGLRPPLTHAANSAGLLYYPEARYDLVRPGVAMYGLHPSAEAPLPAGFRPALSWKARLSSVKVLPPGHGISYGAIYTTRGTERIGILPVGYADGFRRTGNQAALIQGVRAPVVGRVCMDQCAVQLDGLPGARIGDEVVLLGCQGQECISAEELGARWGTVNYEVVCGLASRLKRIYLEGS